jgi:hypothetical protein
MTLIAPFGNPLSIAGLTNGAREITIEDIIFSGQKIDIRRELW